MNPIRNVYVTSKTLPIQATLVSPPRIVGDTTVSMGSVSGDLSNTISDYSLAVSSTHNYNGEIIYQPDGELRMIEMNSAPYLNRVDLAAFWESKVGQADLIYLPPGCCSNLKLLFRHKRFNFGSTYYS